MRRAADAQRKAEVREFMRNQGDLENVFASRLQEAVASGGIELSKKDADPVALPKAKSSRKSAKTKEPVESMDESEAEVISEKEAPVIPEE